MWDAYHGAAREYLPNASPVVDRFHVMKNLNDALSKTRRKAQKKLDEAAMKAMKGIRWLLVRNRKDLTQQECQQLDAMLAHASDLKICYELKESFHDLLNSDLTVTVALSKLDEWMKQARLTGFTAMNTFADTLDNWRISIANYFVDRVNNGFAEGVNNKIRLILRRAYGYHTFQSLRLHILVGFNPKSTFAIM